MDKIKKIYYVYYSFEESGRGYIGYRKCPEGETPESDKYLGSATDKTFKPIGKTILKRNLTLREAIAVEIYFQRKYKVAETWNKEFANLAYQTSEGFCYSASGENNPFFGQTHSEEAKQKIGEAKKGENNPGYGKMWYNNGAENKYFSPEEEIPEGFILGMKEESKQKMSEAQKGENNPGYGKMWYNNGIENKYFSPEEEIPEGFILGRKEETKQKISKARKGKKHSEETKQRLSEAKKGENNPQYGKKSSNAIKVITSTCCYFSVKDAYEELRITKSKFYKLFEKDPSTVFYVEK